jgi:hypothetical protein
MTSQIAVIAVKVVTEAPEFGHGDTEARPKPDPIANKISDDAAVAKAPPMIADQEIPETADSAGAATMRSTSVSLRPLRLMLAILNALCHIGQCQNRASKMMIGIGTPNSHNRIARPMSSSFTSRQTHALER